MSEETQTRRPRFIVIFLSVVAVVVFGWHYRCVQRIESNIDPKRGELSINPVTNTVYLRMAMKKGDGLAKLGLAVFGRQAETYIEMEMEKKTREWADVYAMVVPYRVRITMD